MKTTLRSTLFTVLYIFISLSKQDHLVHVLQMQRHGIAATTTNLFKDRFPNGNNAMTAAGIREIYLSGMQFRHRYLESNKHPGFLNKEIIDH